MAIAVNLLNNFGLFKSLFSLVVGIFILGWVTYYNYRAFHEASTKFDGWPVNIIVYAIAIGLVFYGIIMLKHVISGKYR